MIYLKFLAAKNAGEVLIIRGIFTKAQDAMLSSADKFFKRNFPRKAKKRIMKLTYQWLSNAMHRHCS